MNKSRNWQKNRPNKNRKGKKSERMDDLEDFSDSKDTRRKSTNDPKWYASNPQLLKDAASYPFSQPLGRRWRTSTRTVTTYQTIPGICALRCVPTFGFGGRVNVTTGALTADVNNPVNIAAAEIYTYVRHANSGAKNYEASDLMLYICAMSQVYSAITWAMRIYGLARMFEQRNRYMPVYLTQANGVDYDSVANNLADFRYKLNVIINKVSSLKVPATMPLFQRQAFMYQNVYSEGLSVKDQLYMYTPDYFLKFDLDSSGAGQLATKEVIPQPTGTLLTYQDVIDIIDRMFQAIWDEEDFATMSGDISKAYAGNTLMLNSMNEDYGLIPIYDEMVLTQIKNAKVVGPNAFSALHQIPTAALTSMLVPLCYSSIKMNNWTQVDDCNLPAMYDFIHSDHPLTVNMIEPTPEVVIEATRMFTGEDEFMIQTSGSDQYAVQFYATGTELVTRVWYGFVDGGTSLINWNEVFGSVCTVSTTSTMSQPWVQVARQTIIKEFLLKHFKFAPQLWHYEIDASFTWTDLFNDWSKYSIWADFFEVDNYTTIGSEELKKLHESAILSLLAVGSQPKNASR